MQNAISRRSSARCSSAAEAAFLDLAAMEAHRAQPVQARRFPKAVLLLGAKTTPTVTAAWNVSGSRRIIRTVAALRVGRLVRRAVKTMTIAVRSEANSSVLGGVRVTRSFAEQLSDHGILTFTLAPTRHCRNEISRCRAARCSSAAGPPYDLVP